MTPDFKREADDFRSWAESLNDIFQTRVPPEDIESALRKAYVDGMRGAIELGNKSTDCELDKHEGCSCTFFFFFQEVLKKEIERIEGEGEK